MFDFVSLCGLKTKKIFEAYNREEVNKRNKD